MKLLALVLSIICITYAAPYGETLFKWKYISYDWESTEQKNYFTTYDKYDPKKIIPIDVDQWSEDGRIFVTAAKDLGVPASVHVISKVMGKSGPLLNPYPSWDYYYNQDDPCETIVSVHRIAIDECSRLWMLDTGVLGTARICPAALWIFDLTTDTLIQKIHIQDKFAQDENNLGLLVNLVVETSGSACEQTTVYMADPVGNGIVVYRSKPNDIYRYINDALKPEEQYINFSIEGESFTLAYGIYGMALTPARNPDDVRFLTFSPLASRTIYVMNTRGLRNKVIEKNAQLHVNENAVRSQVSAMAYSDEGILFYGLTHESAIGCWNPYRNSTDQPFVSLLNGPERLQFISSMKFVKASGSNPAHLLVLSNRLQKSLTGTLNINDYNFRILKFPIASLTRNTDCDHI